jgi:hypothetical protein
MVESLSVEYLLFCLAVTSVLLPILAARYGLPFLQVLARWVRWFLFAGCFAFFMHAFELSYRPVWVLYLTGFCLWFIIETGYNWVAIQALNRSDLPLFPSFHPNRDGDEWPAENQFIDLKDWLKTVGFKRLAALKAELFPGAVLRASVYESEDGLTRLQVLFLPKRQGGATACYTIQTTGADGTRLITDNQFLPYGGYYPENWKLCRRPLVGSAKRLMRLHNKRVLGARMQPVPFEEDALEQLNEQQRILERLNTETGFLVPRPRQEEEGKFTSEGRYRLWKEMWTLAYLGKSMV